MSAARVVGGIDAQRVIAARHRGLDLLLAEAIESGLVSQVVELAAGLSARGRDFMGRYGERGLSYVEGDLRGIVELKREALASFGPLAPNHHVVELDALLDAGSTSLDGVGERLLDRGRGVAVICEGLMPYMDSDTTRALWRRSARSLATHVRGCFISEAYFPAEIDGRPFVGLVRGAFAAMTRGRLHLPFHDAAEIEGELTDAGFARVRVRPVSEVADELDLPAGSGDLPVHLILAEVAAG